MKQEAFNNSILNSHKERSRRYPVEWGLIAGHRQVGTVRGRVVNISLTGLLLQVPAEYAIGGILEVELSPSCGVFIRAMIQMVRIHSRTGGIFTYAARLMSLKEKDLSLLRDKILELRRQDWG